MTKEFNNIDEIKKYYNEKTNTYVFKENGKYLDVVFHFDLVVYVNIDAGNIHAKNIYACNINAGDIGAGDIGAWDINARSINYCAVCFAYKNITCNEISGRRTNCKHFVLDGKITIRDNKGK